MNRTTMFTFAAAAALAAAFFTGSTVARSAKYTPDNKIATVNIQAVFDKLQERMERLDQLQREAGRLEGEFKAVNDQINAARNAANAMPEGPAKEAAIEATIDRDVQANIDIKKAKGKLEKEQATTIRSIFDKIQKEAGRAAAINGYSMVMVADDWVQISPRATAQEATQLMSLRRFLYIDNKQHDITAEVLKALNDAYAASKPAATTPAPAAPATGTPAAAPATPPR